MRFISVLIPSFFLSSSVLASRREHLSLSHDLAKKPTNAATNRLANSNNITNWGGALWLNQPHGTFYLVTADFSVPNIGFKFTDLMLDPAASAMVGIDGVTCTDAVLYSGVYFTVNATGPVYDAWYVLPDDPNTHPFDPPVHISPGDVIRLTVSMPWEETSGFAAIQNFSKNQSAIQHFNSQHALCGQDAMWIVSNYGKNKDTKFPLPNFGTVKFLEAQAGGKNGQTYLPQDATITEILNPGGQPLTSVSVDKDTVSIKYLE